MSLLEFFYLVFTRMPGDNYLRWFVSPWSCPLWYVWHLSCAIDPLCFFHVSMIMSLVVCVTFVTCHWPSLFLEAVYFAVVLFCIGIMICVYVLFYQIIWPFCCQLSVSVVPHRWTHLASLHCCKFSACQARGRKFYIEVLLLSSGWKQGIESSHWGVAGLR